MRNIFIDFFKKHKIAIIIFLIALVAHSALFFVNFSNEQYELVSTIRGDDGYFEISRNLTEGKGFTGEVEPPFSPNPLRPPVYPFFIAGILLLFGSYWAVLIIQLLISAVIPILGMNIVNKVIQSNKIAISVGVLLAIEPFSALLSSIFYTETLFIFLFFLFLIFFFNYFKNSSYRNIIWASLFLGLATLVKPTVQFLPIVIPLFILWHFRKAISKKLIMQLVIFIVLFMITISPWLYRNYKEFGVVGMSAQPAFNLYVYLVPSVLSIENKTNFSTELEKFIRKEEFKVSDITLTTSKYYISESLNILKKYPISIIKSIGTSLVTFFTHDGILTVLQHAGFDPIVSLSKPALFLLFNSPNELFGVFKELIATPAALVFFGRITWIILTLTALWGVLNMIIKKRIDALGAFAIFLILYFAGTSVIGGLGVNARHRMPINIFIFTFAIYGFLNIAKKVKQILMKKTL